MSEYGAFPPVTTLGIRRHRAKTRIHICSECFTAISPGDRYYLTVYKDDETGKISQYKTHVFCPYNVED